MKLGEWAQVVVSSVRGGDPQQAPNECPHSNLKDFWISEEQPCWLLLMEAEGGPFPCLSMASAKRSLAEQLQPQRTFMSTWFLQCEAKQGLDLITVPSQGPLV